MNVTPGEPIPPGFEDEIERVAKIQKAIDLYKGNALVGLEYTLELHDVDRPEPSYLCVLCDKRADPRNIMQHWTSFKHRLKYLERHYSLAMQETLSVKYKPNSHNAMILFVQKLAEAIEDHHGRSALSVYNTDDFHRSRTRIISEVNAKYHFDERNGPNFVNTIDLKYVGRAGSAKKTDQSLKITLKSQKRSVSDNNQTDNDKNNRNDFDEISSDSDVQLQNVKKIKKTDGTQQPRLGRSLRSPPFDDDIDKDDDKKLPTPKELSLQASHIAQERYKWEKYRCMLEIYLKQMQLKQIDYEKNPESHPRYLEEWKKFWNRRFKEIQVENKVDPNAYDYKPEWIKFWTNRIEEFFRTEVELKKKEIKIKLSLSEDAEEQKVDQLKEKYKVHVPSGTLNSNDNGGDAVAAVNTISSNSRNRNRNHRIHKRDNKETGIITISDDDSDLSNRKRRRIRKTRSRSHSNSRSFSLSHSRSRSRSRSHDKTYHFSRRRTTTAAHRTYPPPSINGGDYYYMRSRYAAPPSSSSSTLYPPPSHYRILEHPYKYARYDDHSQSPSPPPTIASTKSGINLKSKIDVVEPEPDSDDNSPLTVVAVLRLLTALEEHLGSLGPKVVDMLGKALALEKIKANSSEDLLVNDDHCVFFETVKEKLKGILIAGMLDDQQKVRAIKKAIKNIAAIIYQISSKATNEGNDGTNDPTIFQQNKTKSKTNEIPQVKDLPFDRQLVATKLAAALVSHGRDDISTQDMDKLIFLFVLLTKISSNYTNEGRKLQMKDILPQLGIPLPIDKTMDVLENLPNLVEELLENKDAVVALQQGIEGEVSNQSSEKDSKIDTNSNSAILESLTDSDLQTLLQNFKHLSSEEQHHLITHLKKLESTDPVRVESLRKFVNLNELNDGPSTSKNQQQQTQTQQQQQQNKSRHRFDITPQSNSNASNNTRDKSNFSDDDDDDDDDVGHGGGGGGGGNTNHDNDDIQHHSGSGPNPNKFSLDDETDDDYDFEKMFETAKKNVHRSLNDIKSKSNSSNRDITLDIDLDVIKSKVLDDSIGIVPAPLDKSDLNINLADTQNIIANLMGSLQASNKAMPMTKPLLSMANSQQPVKNSLLQPTPPTSLQQQQQQQQQQLHKHQPSPQQLHQQQHLHQQQQQSHTTNMQQQQHHHQTQQNMQQHQHAQNFHGQQQNNNMPFYQQQPQQQHHHQQMYAGGAPNNMMGYNQMQNSTYYNMPMGDATNLGYNNTSNQHYQAYGGWNTNQTNMQGYGGNFMQHPQQQQQQQQAQQQQQQQMNYNMYGGRGGH